MTVYGQNMPDIFMFLHPPNDSLLTLSRLFNREFTIVPQPRGNFYRELSYEINHRKIKMVNKPQTPCQVGENINVQDCIESYMERRSGCVLPWRIKDSSRDKTCANSTLYKKIHFDLTVQGEFQIYNKTKCQQSCTIMVRSGMQFTS